MTTNDANRLRASAALHATMRTRKSSATPYEKSVQFMTFGTWLFTKMRGELVGTDAEGNRYYQDKKVFAGRRRKRWVIYNGEVEASRVPPDWHGWLHYTTDKLPPAGGLPRKPWQKDHIPNRSGTDLAYRPAGHMLASGDKPKPAYEAWRPS